MSLTTGTRLGPYEILSLLGAGVGFPLCRRERRSMLVNWPALLPKSNDP